MSRFLPRQELISSFGNGGFRFADMSHQGSIISLPGGMRAWPVDSLSEVTPEALELVVAERQSYDFLLIGTGKAFASMPAALASHLRAQSISCDTMDTGAAVHVYNVVLAEGRRVAAALIAVA